MENKRIISGIKWTSIQLAIETFFRFSVRLILAKLLLPNQFGLVGMCAIFITVAAATSELGMTAALIQRKDDFQAEKMYATAFWSCTIWSLLIYLLLSFIIGPLAAKFYDEPELIHLIPALSIVILIQPLGTIPTIILTRSMNFKKIAKIFNSSSFFAGIIAISAAYLGVGVWALVINSVLTNVLAILLLCFTTKWKPRFQWNPEHFKDIFGFGAYSTGTNIFSTITYNIDNLLIGKLLGSTLLGTYTLSFSLTEQLRQMISSILNKVMYPVFGKTQDDKPKLGSYFLTIINLNSLFVYPIMTFLLLFAKPIVNAFGKEWEEAIVPLKILAIAMMVHLLVNSFTALIRGLGKPRLEMKIIIFLTTFVLFPALYIGITNYGLVGAAYAILLNKIALALVGLKVINKTIGLPILQVLLAARSALIGVIISSLLVVTLELVFSLTQLVFLIPVYIIVYLFVVYFLEKDNIKTHMKKLI